MSDKRVTRARDLDDPDAWVAGLREAYARSLDEGGLWWRRAKEAAEDDPELAAKLAEAALAGLSSMGEGDPTSLGMAACEALRRFGQAAQLEPLRELRPRLPARRGLRDWRADADTAIAVIEARAAGRCTCTVEASRESAPYGEQWEQTAPSVAEEYGSRRMSVRCTYCGSRWEVRRDDSYHYPLFSWSSRGRG